MARERYRLQALLVIKEREKKKAEEALALAIKALAEAKELKKKLEKERDEIVRKWKEYRKRMYQRMGPGSSIFDGNIYNNYLRKLKEDEEEKEKEIEEQEERVAAAEEAVGRARKDYIEACKELRIMEKHKELWRKKIEKELTRKEERELNELGNVIHQLRKWHGEETQEI